MTEISLNLIEEYSINIQDYKDAPPCTDINDFKMNYSAIIFIFKKKYRNKSTLLYRMTPQFQG